MKEGRKGRNGTKKRRIGGNEGKKEGRKEGRTVKEKGRGPTQGVHGEGRIHEGESKYTNGRKEDK